MILRVAALGVLYCAAAFAAPAHPHLPSESTRPPGREQLVALIKQRYPELLTVHAQGTPVVTALFGADGRIARTDLEIRSVSADAVTASEVQFERFGLTAPLRYVGLERIEWAANTVVVVWGGLDSRDQGQRLAEHFFPQILTQGATGTVAIWIVFDHEGRVLATGEERARADSINSVLKSRYPGIQVSDVTVTPVMGRDGQPIRNNSGQALQLHCVWLAAGARLPKAKE